MHERYPQAKKIIAVAAIGAATLTACGNEKPTDTQPAQTATVEQTPSTTPAPHTSKSASPSEITPPSHPNATNPQSFRNGQKAVVCEGIFAEVTKKDSEGAPTRYHVFGRPIVRAAAGPIPMDLSISKSGFDAAERKSSAVALWYTIKGEAFEDGQTVDCHEQTVTTRQAIQPNGTGPYVITTSGETSPARFNLDAAALHGPYKLAGEDFGGDITQVALDQILERAAGDPRP